MSWGYYGDYESKSDREARVQKQIEKRRKRGEALAPVTPSKGRDLSATFWGQAWNKNLMSYSDYESRMPRGRTYLRGGKVLDLSISEGSVTSTVAGSDLYEIRIAIKALDKARWKTLKARCGGKIGSLMELLAGRLSSDVLKELTDLQHGLFPSPKEIQLSCSCPDWADMCKHCAATLYAVGTKLDDNPELFFTLRAVNPSELTGGAVAAVSQLTSPAAIAPERKSALSGADLSAMFGVELSGLEALDDVLSERAPAKPKRAEKKKAVR